MTPPSQAATYERARRRANVCVWTVALQVRRLRTEEPEDGGFVLRRWADLEFLIVALTRLRRAGVLASKIPVIRDDMCVALKEFDRALPALTKMRNIAEHFDDYAMDQGYDRNVSRKSLEVGVIAGTRFQWLGCELDADMSLAAASQLFQALQLAGSSLSRHD